MLDAPAAIRQQHHNQTLAPWLTSDRKNDGNLGEQQLERGRLWLLRLWAESSRRIPLRAGHFG
jgi:hypothetical protein